MAVSSLSFSKSCHISGRRSVLSLGDRSLPEKKDKKEGGRGGAYLAHYFSFRFWAFIHRLARFEAGQFSLSLSLLGFPCCAGSLRSCHIISFLFFFVIYLIHICHHTFSFSWCAVHSFICGNGEDDGYRWRLGSYDDGAMCYLSGTNQDDNILGQSLSFLLSILTLYW